ncbi:MAG: DNA replication initiation control protein YabA [Clostridiales bacterium]|nr:DNA replication initiation control protein YabA [Clostridiales bacterium]
MSPTKWKMACEALGIDYDGILAFQEEEQQPEEGQSLKAAPNSSLYTRESERSRTAADDGSTMKPVVYVPAGPYRSAPVLEEALAERDKTIAQMEAALKGVAEENRELWHENKKLREERKQTTEETRQLKAELDVLKGSQSEMIRQGELRVAEEYREAQNLTILKLKAYFFDREHPDLNL